jgi:hypothetical protein
MRAAGIAALLTMPALLALGGCLSPAATVASYAVDGASYAVSDKSLSDHGLSIAKGENCATWHFFVGRAVCEDPDDPVPTASLDEHRRDGSIKHAAGFTQNALMHKRPGDGGSYLAIGSFADRANAERLAGRYAVYHPQIVDAVVDGKGLARVVIGPLDAAQRADLHALGVNGFVVVPPAALPELQQARTAPLSS